MDDNSVGIVLLILLGIGLCLLAVAVNNKPKYEEITNEL
jgi:hypothetical protein